MGGGEARFIGAPLPFRPIGRRLLLRSAVRVRGRPSRTRRGEIALWQALGVELLALDVAPSDFAAAAVLVAACVRHEAYWGTRVGTIEARAGRWSPCRPTSPRGRG